MELLKILKRAGVSARAYKRPPYGKDIFALTIVPQGRAGTILVHQGSAKVEGHASKRLRQAVATVREQGRQITKQVSTRIYQTEKPDINMALHRLKGRFPIMPPHTKWSMTGFKAEQVEKRMSNPCWEVSGKVTARVASKTTNHFLMGMDETHNFISPTAKQTRSVEHAHRMLLPKEARKTGTVRQGEWFFVPVGKGTGRRLGQFHRLIRKIRLGDTTHYVLTGITLSGRYTGVYAKGFVIDNRDGHHRALFLPVWCKAVHNKEVEIKVGKEQAQAAAARRQRRSWD
jgi:hypothetical protein